MLPISFDAGSAEIIPVLPDMPRSGWETLFPSPLAIILETENDWPAWFAVKQMQILALVSSWHGRATLCHELQLLTDQELKMLDKMKPHSEDDTYFLSRRQALMAIAVYPLALLASFRKSSESLFIIEELLSRCAAGITASWHLLKGDGNDLIVVDQTVSNYLPVLVQVAQSPSRYQKTAARLVTQGYRLKRIVALHQNTVKAWETYCQQALYYSEISEDPDSIVAALISSASNSYYNLNPQKASSIYQKALPYIDATSPLLRAKLFAELAVVYAQQGQEKEALSSLELAQKAYPAQPEQDSSFLYAEFTSASMILEEGLTYLALAQHNPREQSKHAWNAFSRIEQLQAQSLISQRVFCEVINQRAETALVLGDQELFRSYLERGVQGATSLSSKQRRREAISAYKKAQILWPRDPKVTELAEIFL